MLITFSVCVVALAFVVAGLYFGLPYLLREDLSTGDARRKVRVQGAEATHHDEPVPRRKAATA